MDEVQKVPALLDEVHRLIESRRLRFALTGSSARKLKRGGANLLAGRALNLELHPLTAAELGADFDLTHSVRFGCLPSAYVDQDPGAFLSSYVATYLREEIQQEGLVRNLGSFSRFLESASFSQGSVLNISSVARDCSVARKVVESYFTILEDLLLAVRIPVFSRRANRKMTAHPKFYLFDAGVYRACRPTGPLDSAAEIDGAALETLVLQQLRACNSYLRAGYSIHCWRTQSLLEVDFVLYGERGLKAFEVKRSQRIQSEDLKGLRAFREDYPEAETYLFYGGADRLHLDGIHVLPASTWIPRLSELL